MEFGDYNDIVQHWIGEVLANRGKNAETVLKLCNDIVGYGMKLGDERLIGFGHYYSGETYYLLNDGFHFFEEMSKALSYLEKVQEGELLAQGYNMLGIWAMNRGNAPIALDYYLNGISYCQKYHLEEQEAFLNINVSTMNMQCGRYKEAQVYLERAFAYIKEHPQNPEYHTYMLGVYANLAKCMLLQGQLGKIEELYRTMYREYWEFATITAQMSALCTEAIYYHKKGDVQKRTQCIQKISDNINQNVAILDMFDDYYDYAVMLQEADEQEEFWHILDILEPLVKSSSIINLQLKLISLKLRNYRKYHRNAEYLQAAGLYYELSERMEQETKSMINSVLNLRRGLETANRARKVMEQQNRILLEKSEMDPLTKLANRFRLNDYSEEIFARAFDLADSLTVEILDIDYFKEYNDNYGHQAGDNCLVRVAEAIKSLAVEQGGFCARYGGDEFVLLYEGKTKEQSVQLAEELKRRILAKDLTHEYSKAIPYVTISQGLCWGVPQKGTRMWDYLHQADSMLYKVKTLSRNNYCLGTLDKNEEPVIGT